MNMEYSTQLKPIIIREYGRNVQRMIEHALTIKDREERNRAAFTTIKVMEQITTEQKKGNELEQKLWDHLFIMSDYALDVDAPYEMPLRPEEAGINIEIPSYPKGRVRYRHYGLIVQEMIDTACKTEDEAERMKMADFIAAYMKLSYKTWNEQKLSDEVILENLYEMSDGRLKLNEIIDITESVASNVPRNIQNPQKSRPKKKKTGPVKKRRKR